MSTFEFPKPGERTNISAVPVPEEYLANLLFAGARDFQNQPCPHGSCSHCLEYIREWFLLYDLLSEPYSLRLVYLLDADGIPLPGELAE